MEDVIDNIKRDGIPPEWLDALKMQSMYSLERKGYHKKVIWKKSTLEGVNIGIFADEPIKKGDLIRTLEENKNLIIFRSREDLPPLTESTIKYIVNYLYGSGEDGSCQMCVPGMSANHDAGRANMDVRSMSDHVTHITCTRDIEPGEEILLDYSKFGQPPDWLVEIKEERGLTILWEGHNQFVKTK